MKITYIAIIGLLIPSLRNLAQTTLPIQNSPITDWTKIPNTHIYSLESENQMREEYILLNQNKYAKGVDINKLKSNIKSNIEDQRIRSIRILGLIPQNNLIIDIEEILQNDPSPMVRMECAKSLSQLKSISSIPILIKELKTEDIQLRLEIALTLAFLGEKIESFKALTDLGNKGEWKITLDTHLGYLYIADKNAVSHLIDDLGNSNSYVSVDAAIILSELGYFKEAFPTLKLKLNDQDKYIRMSALRGLAYIGNNAAIDLIRNSLYDIEPMVRDRSSLILTRCHLL